MSKTLATILTEYSQKRNHEITMANIRKNEFLQNHPNLSENYKNLNKASAKLIQLTFEHSSNEEIEAIKKEILNLQKQRDELYKKYKIDKNYFEPKFECTKCEDTGFVKNEDGSSSLCSCIKQQIYNEEFNNSNIFDLKNQSFGKFNLEYYSDEVNFQKYGKNISPRENILNIEKIVQEFINNFDDPKENNLLFCGNTGLGKTFLSTCIANELIQNGKTVLYQTAPIMLDSIIDYKFGKNKNDIVNSIYTSDLLIIDDLGTEAKNALKVTELFNIINTRLLNQQNKITKTIISTNLSLQQLFDNYDERIASRLIGNYNACYFFGDDIRLQKKFNSSSKK